jgi:hypothetical protein
MRSHFKIRFAVIKMTLYDPPANVTAAFAGGASSPKHSNSTTDERVNGKSQYSLQ